MNPRTLLGVAILLTGWAAFTAIAEDRWPQGPGQIEDLHFGVQPGAVNAQCLTTLDWSGSAAAGCTAGSYATTVESFYTQTQPVLRRVTCWTPGEHDLGVGESVTITPRIVQYDGSGSPVAGTPYSASGSATWSEAADSDIGDVADSGQLYEVIPYTGFIGVQLQITENSTAAVSAMNCEVQFSASGY